MRKNEQLIAEVNGSMSIEGMALTKADKERMMRYLDNPESFAKIIAELVKKHKTIGEDNA